MNAAFHVTAVTDVNLVHPRPGMMMKTEIIKRGAMVTTAVLALMLALAGQAPAQTGDARLAAKFREATAAQRAGNLEQAASAYAEVLKIQPNIAEAYVNFGIVRYQQKRFDDAVELLEKSLKLKPTLGGAYMFLGLAHYSLNRPEPAIKSFEEAVRVAPNDVRALMWLGVTQMAAGRAVEAAKHLDAASMLAPDDVDILYHRGRAHLKLSQESYQRMFKLDPKSARGHQVLAQSYEEAGREADAIAEYELTVQLAPNMPGIHESLGSLYWKTAEMDKAEAAFQKELENDPNNFLALYKLGSIRVERGKPEQGLPLLEQAIRQNPGEVDAYYYLGKGQGILGQHEAAVANLQKVVVGDTSAQLIESAYYQLSQNYRKLGRVAEARTAIEKFQKLKGERERQQAEKVEQIKKQTTSQ